MLFKDRAANDPSPELLPVIFYIPTLQYQHENIKYIYLDINNILLICSKRYIFQGGNAAYFHNTGKGR